MYFNKHHIIITIIALIVFSIIIWLSVASAKKTFPFNKENFIMKTKQPNIFPKYGQRI